LAAAPRLVNIVVVLHTFEVIGSIEVSRLFRRQKLRHRRPEQLLLSLALTGLAPYNHNVLFVHADVVGGVARANAALVVLRFVCFQDKVYAVVALVVALESVVQRRVVNHRVVQPLVAHLFVKKVLLRAPALILISHDAFRHLHLVHGLAIASFKLARHALVKLDVVVILGYVQDRRVRLLGVLTLCLVIYRLLFTVKIQTSLPKT
jgi:hypothetical protein